jgi:hypothetical protein
MNEGPQQDAYRLSVERGHVLYASPRRWTGSSSRRPRRCPVRTSGRAKESVAIRASAWSAGRERRFSVALHSGH